MLYVLDINNTPGLIVVATDDPGRADDIQARYQAETGRVCVIAEGPSGAEVASPARQLLAPVEGKAGSTGVAHTETVKPRK